MVRAFFFWDGWPTRLRLTPTLRMKQRREGWPPGKSGADVEVMWKGRPAGRPPYEGREARGPRRASFVATYMNRARWASFRPATVSTNSSY